MQAQLLKKAYIKIETLHVQLACLPHVAVHCIQFAHTVRIAESREAVNVDYTGQIRQFSEIGPKGPSTVTPRPWLCNVQGVLNISFVQWQTPNGSVVPTTPPGFTIATGNELYQEYTGDGPALIRGPDYNSPDGEYCCVITSVRCQRRCVTLSECRRVDSLLGSTLALILG